MRVLFILIVVWVICSCGVKGDPLPPEEPAYIGRGKPTYKKATKGLSLKDLPPVHEEEEDDDDDDEDDENEDLNDGY